MIHHLRNLTTCFIKNLATFTVKNALAWNGL